MDLKKNKAFLLIIIAILAMFLVSYAVQNVNYFPQTTFFSELSLFGPYNNATYPSNVTANQNLRFYLTVANHLGSSAQYVIEPKFRSQLQSAPNSFNHTSSTLPSLGDISFSAANNESIQKQVSVSFQYHLDPNNPRLLDMESVTLNGVAASVTSTIPWNPDENGFYGNLFFELWISNSTSSTLQYNQRYVSLWLNMTV